jgi:catechol 2,3-dioxygenase-like lactoylglutathione lyase family enzyme
MLIDHVDLRVRNREAATRFYDALLALLGAVRSDTSDFATWRIPAAADNAAEGADSFGITEEPDHVAGAVRIAFMAASREVVDAVVKVLSSIGARNVEMDDGIYGEEFYSVFFEDPDGNRLEVCVNPIVA